MTRGKYGPEAPTPIKLPFSLVFRGGGGGSLKQARVLRKRPRAVGAGHYKYYDVLSGKRLPYSSTAGTIITVHFELHFFLLWVWALLDYRKIGETESNHVPVPC
jgi:hypothetical protein